MNLIKIVDDNGLLINEDFPCNIPFYPYLTKDVADVMIDEDDDGNDITINTTHKEIVTEPITENETGYILNEETQQYEEVVTPVTKQVPVRDKRYVEENCPDGFYHPKWDFETKVWIEGLTQEEITIKSALPIEQRIVNLKEELSSTDYKIIKCYECQMVGDVLPYDVTTLHAERQVLRDKINELEAQITE